LRGRRISIRDSETNDSLPRGLEGSAESLFEPKEVGQTARKIIKSLGVEIPGTESTSKVDIESRPTRDTEKIDSLALGVGIPEVENIIKPKEDRQTARKEDIESLPNREFEKNDLLSQGLEKSTESILKTSEAGEIESSSDLFENPEGEMSLSDISDSENDLPLEIDKAERRLEPSPSNEEVVVNLFDVDPRPVDQDQTDHSTINSLEEHLSIHSPERILLFL
jgi:hypothetical protein